MVLAGLPSPSSIPLTSTGSKPKTRRTERGVKMVSSEWVEAEVRKAVPEAVIEVVDLHGSESEASRW